MNTKRLVLIAAACLLRCVTFAGQVGVYNYGIGGAEPMKANLQVFAVGDGIAPVSVITQTVTVGYLEWAYFSVPEQIVTGGVVRNTAISVYGYNPNNNIYAVPPDYGTLWPTGNGQSWIAKIGETPGGGGWSTTRTECYGPINFTGTANGGGGGGGSGTVSLKFRENLVGYGVIAGFALGCVFWIWRLTYETTQEVL